VCVQDWRHDGTDQGAEAGQRAEEMPRDGCGMISAEYRPRDEFDDDLDQETT
jgi:hypothetical protein